MYEYIFGKLTALNPANCVLDVSGVGYLLNISLASYAELETKKDTSCKLFVHQIIREDTNQLYGFFTLSEREMFRLLISVSGVGANTARVVLSTLSAEELKEAVETDDFKRIQSVKGIGIKTAQRIVIDLKGKMEKTIQGQQFSFPQSNTTKEEALSALVMLGFVKNTAEKAISRLMKKNPELTVEELVKQSLKQM